MNTQVIALTCALTAVACGSSSARPAHVANSDADATATADGSTATASQPVVTTAEPLTATTDNKVETTAAGDRKATGTSPYVAAKPATPAVEANPRAADE